VGDEIKKKEEFRWEGVLQKTTKELVSIGNVEEVYYNNMNTYYIIRKDGVW